MAKNTAEDKGKVKFRFVEFELEGLNSTIEEGIKSIVHSMSRSSGTPVRVISGSKSPAQLGAEPSAGNGHDELEPEVLATDLEAEESAEETKNSRATKSRRYTVPKFLSEIDLDSGDPSFKAFAE